MTAPALDLLSFVRICFLSFAGFSAYGGICEICGLTFQSLDEHVKLCSGYNLSGVKAFPEEPIRMKLNVSDESRNKLQRNVSPSIFLGRESNSQLRPVTGTSESVTSPYLAIQIHQANKAVVTMLCDSCDLNGRFEQELSELVKMGRVQVASSTLLVSGVASKLFRDIGFVLDSDKCDIRGIYPNDAGSFRVDRDGDKTVWRPEKNGFCKSVYGKKVELTEFCGDFQVSKHATSMALSSLAELSEGLKRKYKDEGWQVPLNEVVVDYDLESIVGLVVATNMTHPIKVKDRDDRMTDFSKKIKKIVMSRLGLDLPIYLYDCSSGAFSICDSQ